MKKLIFVLSLLAITNLNAKENLKFFITKAIKNNLQLNAERKNLESAKQEKNISRSEFLPSITISGSQTSSTSSNQTDQNGSNLADSSSDTESKKISIEQKIFTGFKGVNTFKKSELETERAKLKLLKVEQQTILDTAFAYFDLFERQFEFDNARLQKGQITLTDLAQSESSLAGAKASLIKAKTEFQSSKTNFERVTREKVPNVSDLKENIIVELPESLETSLELSKLKNLDLLISKLNLEIAKKNLKIEKARLSPSATLEFSKSEQKDFSSTIDEKDDEILKAKISWPIIKGGENISSIKKSNFNKQRAELIVKDLINKVITETSNSWSKYKSSKSVLDATRTQLKAAEIANEGITLEYDSGNTRTTLEVIQSRSLLLDARIAYAKAQRDFTVSQFELANQIGFLSINSIN